MWSRFRLAKEAPARCLGRPRRRPWATLNGDRRAVGEGLRPNSRSIGVRSGGPDRSDAHGPRDRLGRHVAAVGGFPAGANLIPAQRQPLPIETAIADLCGHGATEVAAGTASGAGSATDPAPSGLGLGRRAVWASPKLHGPMVAAMDPPVDSVYSSAVSLVDACPGPIDACPGPRLQSGWCTGQARVGSSSWVGTVDRVSSDDVTTTNDAGGTDRSGSCSVAYANPTGIPSRSPRIADLPRQSAEPNVVQNLRLYLRLNLRLRATSGPDRQAPARGARTGAAPSPISRL